MSKKLVTKYNADVNGVEAEWSSDRPSVVWCWGSWRHIETLVALARFIDESQQRYAAARDAR